METIQLLTLHGQHAVFDTREQALAYVKKFIDHQLERGIIHSPVIAHDLRKHSAAGELELLFDVYRRRLSGAYPVRIEPAPYNPVSVGD